MSHSIKLMAIGAVFALAAAVPAIAQPPGSQGGRGPGGPPSAQVEVPLINVFVRPGYTGQNFGFTTSQERTPGGVVFGSATVRGTWQLCSGPVYSGQCITVDRDTPNLDQTFPRGVGSFRIVSGSGSGGGSGRGPSMPQMPQAERGDNANLRGATAAFYPRPAERGFRVAINDDDRNGSGRGRYDRSATRPDQQDVRNEANRFCRINGYAQSRNDEAELVNGRYYLSDVLCVRDGNNRPGRR